MSAGDLADLLERLRSGDAGAERELLPLVYEELHGLARSAMRGEGPQTLQTTALVNEAWMRLFRGELVEPRDRGHFFCMAARAMRNVLVDAARARRAVKRGGRSDVELRELELLSDDAAARPMDLLDVHEALEKLSAFDPELADLVELRFFAGLSIDETAEALGTSPSSVDRGWRVARAWMRSRLAESDD